MMEIWKKICANNKKEKKVLTLPIKQSSTYPSNRRPYPDYLITPTCDYIRAKHEKISSELMSVLDDFLNVFTLQKIVISYLLLDPRIIDMIGRSCDARDSFNITSKTLQQFSDDGVKEVRLKIIYDPLGYIRELELDDGYHRKLFYYHNQKIGGDALIALFGRAKYLLSHQPNHPLARLLNEILICFDEWSKLKPYVRRNRNWYRSSR